MREVEFVDKNNGTAIGYVYVVECEGHYKIGKTMTCTNRFYEYTKLFSEPILICCELVKDYGNVEKELHKMFAEKHTRGEWFILDDNDLCLIKKYLSINKANGNISFRVKSDSPNDSTFHISVERKENYNICESNENVSIKKKYVKTSHKFSDVALKFVNRPTTFMIFVHIMKYIQPNTNYLIKNGKKLKITDVADEIKTSKQACGVHFKIMQQANLITKYKTQNGYVWVVNPNYCMAGQTVPKNIVRLFERK